MGMVSLDACIYTIIAVLGVAYPILLQVISRLDDKYSSVRAVGLFEEEPVRKWFERFLIGSVVAVLIWFSRHLVPTGAVTALGNMRGMLVSLALALVYLTTCGLLVFFFLLTRKTLTYYNAQKLSGYLQASYLKDREQEQYFEVLSDVFLAAVVARNSPIIPELAAFFSDQFAAERSRAGEEAVDYPPAYYQLTARSTEELALLGNRKSKSLVRLAAGGGWLLGGHQHQLISERTYTALWHNLRIALDYEQEDMVYEYWRIAQQHFESGMKRLKPDYAQEGFSSRITNEPAIEARNEERTRFLEFNYVLGALVLYTGRRELLRRMFSYTTSQPPRYPLLPEHMTEIFTLFVTYYQLGPTMPLDIRYSFPNEAGLASESLINKWLFTYSAVLLLRQYTLGEYLVWDRPRAHPVLPESQPAKNNWLSALGLLRRYVTQVLQDEELLRSLQLDFITEAWCRQHRVEHPLDLLTAVEQELQAAYRRGADELALSQDKVEQFYTDSGRITERAAEAVLRFAIPEGTRAFLEARYLHGQQRIVDKDDFSEEPEVHHFSFSDALAISVEGELKYGVAQIFAHNQTVTYRVRQQEIFAVLDKLGIGPDHVIINLRLNLSHLATQAQATDWQPDTYRGSEVLDLQAGSLTESLFIMRRAELPAMRLLPADPAIAAKYELREISQRHRLYASVLDANDLTGELAQEVQNGEFGDFKDGKLKSQALELIWLLLEFKWQQGAKLVWLVAPHTDEGNWDDLAAVAPF
jgi:hypothetical protein